ncbi:hypothetical protein DSECCO2_568550 [anaerobic digester metagenome]
MQHRQPCGDIVHAVVEHRRDHRHLAGVARFLLDDRSEGDRLIKCHASILYLGIKLRHNAVLKVFEEFLGHRLHIFTDVKIIGVREEITLKPPEAQIVLGHHINELISELGGVGIADKIRSLADAVFFKQRGHFAQRHALVEGDGNLLLDDIARSQRRDDAVVAHVGVKHIAACLKALVFIA